MKKLSVTKTTSCIIIFALSSLLICTPALSESEVPAMTPAPKILTGGVEHAEELGSVDQNWRVGKRLSQVDLPKLDGVARNLWFRIPNWMAGHRWVSEQTTKTYEEDLRTHKVKTKPASEKAYASESWGWQRDRNGDIWQFDATPYTAKTERTKDYTINLCDKPWEQLTLEADRMVVRVSNTDVTVTKSSDRIVDVLQKEVIMTFTEVTNGVLKREYSSKVFDEDGQPLRILKGYSISRRMREFTPWNNHKGQDVRAAFAQFLTENGRSDLIPLQNETN